MVMRDSYGAPVLAAAPQPSPVRLGLRIPRQMPSASPRTSQRPRPRLWRV